MSSDDLQTAVARLGINPELAASPKAAEVVRLEIRTVDDVRDRLNENGVFRNRFILLPNVNDGGDDSILRTGFFQHYKTMHCVGGYVDGALEGYGKRNIIDGNDDAWGNKKIGVIQTSDFRTADFSRLGRHLTWVKWSESTPEAIRQACLSPASRLRFSSPILPETWISALEVTASKFFSSFRIELNPQVNAVIGGRGSGKSTILEYVRWALCDQPYGEQGEEGSELPDYVRRRKSLISNTLMNAGGEVRLHLVRNGVLHRIRREASTGRVFLQIADQPEQATTEEVVQSLASIQGYSQKQLSHVSVRRQELERLLTTPVAQELSNIEAEIRSAASSLRQAFERIEVRRNLEGQFRAIEQDLASKNERLRVLSEEVRDLPEAQRKDIEEHPAYRAGEKLVNDYRSILVTSENSVQGARETLLKLIRGLPEVGTCQPNSDLTTVRVEIDSKLRQFDGQIQSMVEAMHASFQEISGHLAEAERRILEHNGRYAAASSENSSLQERLDSLRAVTTEIARADAAKAAFAVQLEGLSDSNEILTMHRQRWLVETNRKEQLLATQAASLTGDQEERLRVLVRRSSDIGLLKTAVQDAVRGAGITTPEKFDTLIGRLLSAQDPVATWLLLGEELIALARVGPFPSTGAALPNTPQLSAANFKEQELRRVASKLSPTAAFELTLYSPDVIPIFEYRTDGGEYIPFENASPGQQATALIQLLLGQSRGPLLIDQPEDDLDNTTILDVAERVWGSKEKRQIIFSTHNPNLVVIGDAELVIHCDYCQPGTSTRVQVSHQGAIDNPVICEVITRVMEGGEEAFDLRKQKYGF
jgi:type III restriction enzyme